MRLLWIYLFTILASFSIAHVCTDDWELVHLRDGPACWALLGVPDFSSEYDTAVKVCDAANAKGAEVQNVAEKAILADIANRVLEPTLTCYKVSRAAVEGQFKSVDYASPPEYLRKINEEGKVNMAKGIEKGDTITIGFSVKMVRPDPEKTRPMVESRIRIGNSSNSSQYSIDVKCSESSIKQCEIQHPPRKNTKSEYVQLVAADMVKKLSVDKFGLIEFDFRDKRIHVLGYEMPLPDEFSYIGMDEILVENMIVTRLEHSKKCQDTDYYAFGTKTLTKELPDTHLEAQHVPLRRRTLESTYTFHVPSTLFDFYTVEGDKGKSNPWIFDVRMAGKEWKFIQVEFWNREGNKSTEICKFRFDDQALMFISPNKSKQLASVKSETAHGHPIVNMRFKITSTYTKMMVSLDLISRGVNIKNKRVEMENRAIDEIRLISDKIDFFEAQMTLLEEVTVTTCNYRKMEQSHMEEYVPFTEECFKNRNILCQKKAEDLPGENVVDEEKEKIVWEEERKQPVTEQTTEAPRRENEEVVRGNFAEEISVENIGGFQWCIIGLTTLAGASFIAIFVLNMIRCAL